MLVIWINKHKYKHHACNKVRGLNKLIGNSKSKIHLASITNYISLPNVVGYIKYRFLNKRAYYICSVLLLF